MTLLFSLTSKAQNNAKSTNQINPIIKTWYESPTENKGDILVFKTTKHVNVPGVDVMGMEYTTLTLSADKTCKLDFGQWCSNHKNHLQGSWSFLNENTVILNFGSEGCTTEMTIVSSSKDELKVQIKETK